MSLSAPSVCRIETRADNDTAAAGSQHPVLLKLLKAKARRTTNLPQTHPNMAPRSADGFHSYFSFTLHKIKKGLVPIDDQADSDRYAALSDGSGCVAAEGAEDVDV